MIKLDVLINYMFNRYNPCPNNQISQEEVSNHWTYLVWNLERKIKDCLKGFPGIGMNDISLISFNYIEEDDIWIVDKDLSNLISEEKNNTPIMLKSTNNINTYQIIGVGYRENTSTEFRVGEMVVIPTEDLVNSLILRVDCRPTENGGPGYYYFYKFNKS